MKLWRTKSGRYLAGVHIARNEMAEYIASVYIAHDENGEILTELAIAAISLPYQYHRQLCL